MLRYSISCVVRQMPNKIECEHICLRTLLIESMITFLRMIYNCVVPFFGFKQTALFSISSESTVCVCVHVLAARTCVYVRDNRRVCVYRTKVLIFAFRFPLQTKNLYIYTYRTHICSKSADMHSCRLAVLTRTIATTFRQESNKRPRPSVCSMMK